MKTLRYAVRSLKKSPGFTAVAVVALALGIGANTAIFSLVEAIFLQPLPYEHSERLVQVNSSAPDQGIQQAGLSWPRLEVLRERQQVFSDVSVSIPTAYTVTGLGDPEQQQSLMVSRNYFPLLGVKPAVGRTFVADEEKPGGPAVVMLSNGFWQSHFGGRPDVVGKTITLDGKAHEIVGVLPATVGTFPLAGTQLFTARPFEAPFLNRKQIDDGGFFFNVIGRLRPGVELAQARAEMDVIEKSYAQTHASNVDAKSKLTANLLLDNLVGNERGKYATLFGAVVAVLLIACANVANLVLARFARRRREIGIRVSLGARRGHIVLQLLAESLLLALTGAVLGLGLAWASLRIVTRIGENVIPRADSIGLNPTVLAFTLGVALVTGLALGLLTAFNTPMRSLAATVGDASRGSIADRRRNRAHSVLLVAEIAASFVLLVATGLLVRSFLQIRDVKPGFRSDHTFVGFIAIPAERYPWRGESTVAFYTQLYHRLQQIPGAKQVALSDNPPLSGNNGQSPYAVIGRPLPPAPERPLAIRNLISPGRFALLGIPVVEGRDFNEHDGPNGQQVIIINQSMAKQLFPNESPLGHTLVTGMMGLEAEIVGVVADTHTAGLAAPPGPEMYYPVLQRPEQFQGILVRTDGDPLALTASVRAAVADVDPAVALTNPGTLQQLVDQSMADRKLTMNLLLAFAGLALLLASLGVYSVMAYSVAQRNAEIGVRMAIGASAETVQKMVLSHGMKLAGVGLGIGLVAALALTRLMAAMLFDVGARDPIVYLSIGALLCGVAALACWLPSRRAARVDPVRALQMT
ncbi:MAG TPA: ABC transporter permease [Thermoanaerobaculia bacterium]|jgi:putative ABC transport system permease protein|nr:ABC transporter permease [Thermoanaerobaculia bacterium]